MKLTLNFVQFFSGSLSIFICTHRRFSLNYTLHFR